MVKSSAKGKIVRHKDLKLDPYCDDNLGVLIDRLSELGLFGQGEHIFSVADGSTKCLAYIRKHGTYRSPDSDTAEFFPIDQYIFGYTESHLDRMENFDTDLNGGHSNSLSGLCDMYEGEALIIVWNMDELNQDGDEFVYEFKDPGNKHAAINSMFRLYFPD